MDVKTTTMVIGKLAVIVADYEARIETLEHSTSEILCDCLHLNTDCLSDEGIDAIIDAIKATYVEIRDTAIATIAEQSAHLTRVTGEVSHLPIAVGRSAILNLYWAVRQS